MAGVAQVPSTAKSPTSRAVALGLLLLAHFLYNIDRSILNIIGEPIKVALKLTDQQIGWLGGLSFSLLYAIATIPIARLAERMNRVSLIAVALVVWSGFTGLCGLATSFVQLFLSRLGVGIGEAGLVPAAQSLITDLYEPKKRASALSIFALGAPLGGMFGAIVGGWIAQHISWQAAFLMVGLPGVAVALVFKLAIREPVRGGSEPQGPAVAAEATSPPSLLAVARRVFGTWSLLNVAAGLLVTAFATYGSNLYTAPYFIRHFGLNLATVGLLIGLIAGVCNGAGTLFGGFLTDWAAKYSVRWYTILPGLGLILASPMYVYAYTRESWQLAVACLLLPAFIQYLYLGPTYGVLHNVVDVRMRATAVALMILAANLVGIGLGPPFCGWLIDHFGRAAWAARGLGGDFLAMCPGGRPPPAAPAAIAAACKAALADGTQKGLIVSMLIYVWAGIHYLLAAITLPRDFASARAGAA